MIAPQFVHGTRPQGWVEVDAARLLLILARFGRRPDAGTRRLPCLPAEPFERHFASEYYLQKLDFLLRYPPSPRSSRLTSRSAQGPGSGSGCHQTLCGVTEPAS